MCQTDNTQNQHPQACGLTQISLVIMTLVKGQKNQFYPVKARPFLKKRPSNLPLLAFAICGKSLKTKPNSKLPLLPWMRRHCHVGTLKQVIALSFKAYTAWGNEAKEFIQWSWRSVFVSAELFSYLYIHAVRMFSRRMKKKHGISLVVELLQEREHCESSE